MEPHDIPLLEAADLTKVYRKNGREIRALGGVSVRLAKGDFIAVEGPSGCGKSTLLLACGLMLRPDSGSLRLGDADAGILTPDARARLRARMIGFVFQQFHLVPFLTVTENILAPSLALRCERAETRAATLAERFGLADRARHYPSELSVGERQRVALARALFNGPKILLADEPTGNLDTANATSVLDALAGFAAEGGAVLLVTHDPRAAGRATTRMAMRDGILG